MPGSRIEAGASDDARSVVDPILEIRGVSKAFGGVHALENVDMHVEPGRITALVGENGAGKSTLIKCVTGILQPDAGEIHFAGQEVHWRGPHDARAAGIEAVHQSLGLADNLDVAANIFLGREKAAGWLRGRKLAVRSMRADAGRMLREFGVSIPVRSQVRFLSGGQRQSVSVARATGWGARLIVMDEPTAALGVMESIRVLELVRSLAAQGLGVVVISHNLEQVRDIADTVWVLRRGRMVARLEGEQISSTNLVRYITGLEEEPSP